MQFGLRLIQLEGCVEAIVFSPLLLAELFLCLGARFEELRAQTLDELVGVIEHISPVARVERPRYNSAAAEKKVVFVVAGTGVKHSRNCFLVIAKPKQFLAIFNHDAPAFCRRNRDRLKVFVLVLGTASAPVSFSFTKRASSNVNAPLQHEHGIRVSEFFNPQSSSLACRAPSAVSKGRSKFRM